MAQPEIIFTTEEKLNSLKYPHSETIFWGAIEASKVCSPDIINTKDWSNTSHVFEKVDNTRSPVTCAASRTLLIKRNDNRIDYPISLNCISSMWQYEKSNGMQTETVVIGIVNDEQEIVEAYCTASKCSLCQSLQNVDCAGCTPAIYRNESGKCATSTCDNGLWRISEGGGDPVEGEMKCEHKKGSQDQKQSVWYFTRKGKSEPDDSEIWEASCAIDAVCLLPNPDDSSSITRLGCPPRDGISLTCDSVQEQGSKKDLHCRSGYQLRYKYDDKITDATNLTCSVITGKYSDESNNILPDGSQIFCEQITGVTTTTETPVVAAASALSTGAIVGVSVGAIVILAIVAGVGGFYFTLHRKKKEIAENERRQKEDFKYRANLANIAAAPNPEVEVYRREVPVECRTRWELRPYRSGGMESHIMQRAEWEERVYGWDNVTFTLVVLSKFLDVNAEGRQKILRHLTAFDEYSVGERQEKEKGKKPSEQFGNLKQFFFLWDYCRIKMFDCPCCWEFMWRFMRMLYENFRPHDDQREICKIMLKWVVQLARPLLNELTYKPRTWEAKEDTLLRPLAIRMLLWAEAPDVIAEMRRMADLPITELDLSIRPAVLQYAARYMGRAEEMKTKYWLMIEQGTEMKKTDDPTAGTIRQHLLYALCSARDETKKGTPDEFKMLREMMTLMFKYNKMDFASTSYTPADQLWAIRGASEFVSNFKPVLDLFIELAPKNLDEVYEKHVDHTVNWDLEKKKFVKLAWRYDVRNLYNLLAEMCTMKSQFNELARIVGPMVNFVKQGEEKLIQFDVDQLGERALNFGNLFARKDVTDIFSYAINETGERIKKADGNAEKEYINKKKKKKVNYSALHSRPETRLVEDDDDEDE